MTTFSRPITLLYPSAIEFGWGTAARLGPWAETEGHRKILVVADAFNATRLDCLGLKGDVAVFADIHAEPQVKDLDAALAQARLAPPDLVVGFGGGSAMDLAKLVAVLHDSEQTLEGVVGPDKVKGRRSALVQVPTTSGTGSEVGIRALIAEGHRKLAVESRCMLADLAIVDPELTATVPPHVTAATGIDAMAHCVESFTNKNAHPTIDLYAAQGARMVGEHLARAVRDGGDADARTALSLASMYGGLCLGPVNTAAGHAVAYPLGTRYAMPHGLANALIFPHVLAFNAPSCPEKTALVLECLGHPCGDSPSIEATFEAASEFCRSVGIDAKDHLPRFGANDLDEMADEAFAIKRLLDNNPREVGRDDILAMYKVLAGA